ncbi:MULTISPECIES: ankyrin repeat domain-containing protein [Parachlamydia]|uniref:ankyrin repeat domain-containing protein n=1 Tax=Parachlamydia TaxID=83551 RepID=UPI0002D63EC2|nr:ankyrin repeat domain-containing protein [Parachlamydia acanthamoebae]
MLNMLKTAIDIEHVMKPFDKDEVGHSSLQGKLAGSTVMLVGGVATLGLLPVFYFLTAYRKTHYWDNIANRITKLNAVQNSTVAQQAKKAQASFEQEFIQKHVLKELRFSLATKSFDKIKQEIEKNKFNVQTIDNEGYSLLHYAVLYEKTEREKRFENPRYKSHLQEVFKLLDYLKAQPSLINKETKKGDTPLSLIAENGLEQTFFQLIDNPDLNVNARNPESLTPLQLLARKPPTRAAEMARALINHPKFDLVKNVKLPQKYPATLASACEFEQLDLVLELLALPGSELVNQPTHKRLPVMAILLDFFERKKNYEGLAFLIEKRGINYDTDKNNGSLLHYALDNVELGCVKFLIKDPRIDVNTLNKEGNTPLDIVKQGSEIEKLLLERGASKSADL